MYWLKGCVDFRYRTCDVRRTTLPRPYASHLCSSCACPESLYHEAKDGTNGCIDSSYCPAYGVQTDTITDDMLFKIPSDVNTSCDYQYKVYKYKHV